MQTKGIGGCMIVSSIVGQIRYPFLIQRWLDRKSAIQNLERIFLLQFTNQSVKLVGGGIATCGGDLRRRRV